MREFLGNFELSKTGVTLSNYFVLNKLFENDIVCLLNYLKCLSN